jgi:RecA/RadA recombinase
MAKKQKTTLPMGAPVSGGGKKQLDFTKMSSILSEFSDHGFLADDEDPCTEMISTGIYIFNAVLSGSIYGGIPANRITAIGGESGTGKTYVCLNIAREAQKAGYSVIYIDTESAIDRNTLSTFGVDPKNTRIERLSVVEDIKIYFAKFLKKMKELKASGIELPKMIMFLDSLGMLASRKEVEDAAEGKESADMTKAKQLRSLFKIIANDLSMLGIPMVITNHTYVSMGMFPVEVFSGGGGAIYSASTIMMLSKAKLKTGNEGEMDMSSGIVVTAKAYKNRMAKPKKVKFEIDATKGANKYKGLEVFLTGENFNTIGVAKGKIDKETGEFKEGGNKYYVSHLDKSFFEKEIYNGQIFNEKVLNAIDDIVQKEFKYLSLEEALEYEKNMENELTKLTSGSNSDEALESDSSELDDLFDM